MDRARLLRNVANVVNASSLLGLAVAVASGARLRVRDSLLVADRARLPWLRASAMTIGSVVLVPRQSLEEVERRIPRLLAHEDAHAWQYAYCFGLPFLPLYGIATLWSMARTKDRALRNVFEVQAGLDTGGYLNARGVGRSERPAARNAGDAGA